MDVPTCEYLKIGGGRCGSPAFRNYKYCYYHVRVHEAMPMTTMFVEENPNVPEGEIPVSGFPVPLLDDGAAIQIGFMQLIHGVSHNRLNPRQAKLILSALHGAASNLRQMDKTQASAQAALKRSVTETAPKKKSAIVTVAENKSRKRA